ncbi:Eukaryotic aspartyl protease family protein [Cryptosporidium meleagridis]|uniref:Eukaryotic aspartyl protease family protein n=1 Tax=Cryptosporidium meleagridis TaxID=93969 RepID=A0A2P4YWR8_9CRYT|nr:Eukaryotic aspartyl protease family protein [Cryptosporidium meleagridis]
MNIMKKLIATLGGAVLFGCSFSGVEARIQMKAYGSIVSTAYYYSDIFVGLPEPQRQSVILDTGSNLLAFSSTQCQQCGTHLDAYYDPFKSITKREIPCHSYCKVCVNNKKQCAYTIHYLEGSSLSGSYFEDFVAIRNEKGVSSEPSPYVIGLSTIFGGITHETNLFFTQAASGILGLAYTASSQERAPLFQTWTKRSKYAKDAILSLCFSSEGGMISLGGYNSEYWVLGSNDKSFRSTSEANLFERALGYSFLSSSSNSQSRSNSKGNNLDSKIGWTPLSILNGNYYVQLTKVSVHQTKLTLHKDSSSGNTKPIPLVIDSGTTLSYFPEHIFIQILNVINQRIAETENKSTFRSLIEAGSKILEYTGLKSSSSENELDLGIKQISIFPGEVPGAALHRKRVYRKLNNIEDIVNTFNSTVHPEDIESSNSQLNHTDQVSSHFNQTTNTTTSTINTPFYSQDFDIDSSVSRIMLETSKGERCWKLRDPNEMSRFPTITLGFPGLKVEWEPAQYLYKKYRNTYCLGFDSDKSFLVLGASFFINKDVIIDVKNSRASFVKSNCPQIAHARRTSSSEMAQLLKDASSSSPESIMKSEVVVFDSNTKHLNIQNANSNNQNPNLSSGTSSKNPPSYRHSVDNETIPESHWEPKNLTSPSSLSSYLSPSAVQYTGVTNHSVEYYNQSIDYENLGNNDMLILYLKQQLHDIDDAADNPQIQKNVQDASNTPTDSKPENQDTNSVNKNSSSRYSNSQPTIIHWLIILLTALFSCYLFNGADQKNAKTE